MTITPIILAFNQRYLLPALTTILSVITHCSDLKRIEFFILHRELNPFTVTLVTRFIHSHGALVTFVTCRNAFDSIGLVSHDLNRPMENYYPLLVPRYFASYKKCLFLDADLLIRDDVLTIIDAMPADKKLGVARDTLRNHMTTANTRGWHDYSRNVLHLTNLENYFNSGVLLFNMDAITKNDQTSCLELIKKNWLFHDEAILNHVFHDSLHIFPARWNLDIESRHLPHAEFRDSFQEDLQAARQNPAICHFVGSSKPWRTPLQEQDLPCYHEYTTLWQQVKKELPPIAASVLCGSLWDTDFLETL